METAGGAADPDMLEGDLPVVIDWQAMEDLDWDLLTEYR
ncbi:hypothetical protein [Stenotrophomonas phage CM2]